MDSRGRASGEQFSTLLEFMESHGDLTKPQPGTQGRIRADRLWQELTSTLNSVGGGVHKTADKWKKVWADWKSKTKKKALLIRRHAGGTGGGPNSRLTLTAFEERLLRIMGALAVEGDANIEEQGFNRPSTANMNQTPSVPPSHDITFNLDLEPSIQNVFAPLPSPSPPPNDEPQPSTSQAVSSPPRPATSRAHRRLLLAPPTPSLPPPVSPRSTSRRRSQTPTTPRSSLNSPRRAHFRARRRRAQTPFDRAVSEFVAVEQRRLQMEETRERQLHERECRRIEVDRERDQLLRSIVEVAQAWLEYLRSRDNTPRLTE